MIAVKHEDRGPGRKYRGWHKGRILSGASIAPKRLHKINLEAGIEASASRTDPLTQSTQSNSVDGPPKHVIC